MKKQLFITFSVIIIGIFLNITGTKEEPTPTDTFSAFITADDQPTELLLELCTITGISARSLEEIVAETQKVWLRPANKERFEITESKYPEQALEITEICRKAGMLKDKYPRNKQYTHILILGGFLGRVRCRVAFFAKLLEDGISAGHISLLGGKRPLHPEKESTSELYNAHNDILTFKNSWQPPIDSPKNETDMMRMVIEQSELPEQLSLENLHVIHAPAQNGRRPDTRATVREWLKTNPEHGSILVLSSQPYVAYQHELVKSCIDPKKYTLETVGTMYPEQQLPDILLDTVARILYTHWQQLKTA